MAIQIFIIHSIAPRELAIMNTVAEVAASKGAVPIISLRDWDPKSMPSYIESQINSSNYVIAIVTRNGHHLDWVNAEIAYSQRVKNPILIVADEGINIKIPPQYNTIRINRAEPFKTFSAVTVEIQKWVDDETTKKLLKGIVIGGLILLLLTPPKGE